MASEAWGVLRVSIGTNIISCLSFPQIWYKKLCGSGLRGLVVLNDLWLSLHKYALQPQYVQPAFSKKMSGFVLNLCTYEAVCGPFDINPCVPQMVLIWP